MQTAMAMLVDINGSLGSGKTLLMTYFASKIRNRPIFANYHLKLPNYHPFKLEDLVGFKSEESLILVDEAYVLLESRTSMDKLNQYVSYILFQSRKRQLDFIVTAQLNSSLDLRYKELTDVNIVCQKGKDRFQYVIQYGMRAKLFELPFENAEKYYGLYDTTELVIPMRMEEMVEEIENMNPDVLNQKVADTVEKIKGKFASAIAVAKRLTHDEVRDWLLQLRESASVEPYVYARLNSELAQRQQK